jgi:hypothetical protein
VFALDQFTEIVHVTDEELCSHEGNRITRTLPTLDRQVVDLSTMECYLSPEVVLHDRERKVGNIGLSLRRKFQTQTIRCKRKSLLIEGRGETRYVGLNEI